MRNQQRQMPEPSSVTDSGLDVHTTLKQITESVEGARAALADEHEGDFTEAVSVLYENAAALHILVKTW
jgi:hypothetical protein